MKRKIIKKSTCLLAAVIISVTASMTVGAACKKSTASVPLSCTVSQILKKNLRDSAACKNNTCKDGTDCNNDTDCPGSDVGNIISNIKNRSCLLNSTLSQLLNKLPGKCDSGKCNTADTPSVKSDKNQNEQTGKNDTEEKSDAPAKQDTNVKQDTAKLATQVSDYEKKVVDLVNKERTAYGLKPLVLNEKLSNVAREKSRNMHDLKYFSHTSPTYGSPFDMMRSFGISYRSAGENIAMGYATPETVVDAWMKSPGHRANILNSSFTDIGVGYVKDGNYCTQMFIG